MEVTLIITLFLILFVIAVNNLCILANVFPTYINMGIYKA